MTFSSRFKERFAAAALLLLAPLTAAAQLNENCTVSVLNRTTQARADGSWVLPDVPANAGQVRARATCVENGVTRSGQSALFVVPTNGVVDRIAIVFNNTAPIPVSLDLTAALSSLGAIGATSQLTAAAVYADFQSVDVTAGSTGTTYFTSNPNIATVDDDGMVTARGTGTALLSALHEGALGMTRVTISTTGDGDGDGIPDDFELANGLDPNNPADAQADADGDGLKNIDEFRLGTDLRAADSDGDGLRDGEEAVLGADGFITNPLLADTDGDGLRDGLEVQTGSDPTNRNSYNLASALSGITVAPSTFTLLVNTLVGEAYTQLVVSGTLLDGYTIDLTSTTRGTNYDSSDPNIANFGSPDGRVFAGGDGAATITVTNNGFTATSSGLVRTFTPLPLSSLAIPGYANNVEVQGDFAYVAAGSAGLQVVNVANPAAPSIVGSRSTSGNANDVRLVGTLAYIANGSAGVCIVNVSNPASPVVVGSVSTGGEAMDLVVVGNVVYVANGNAGLAIVNAANPAAPILVGSVDTPGVARGVDVSGNYAVIADDSSSGARIIDISVPTNPRIVGNLTLSGNQKDLRITGTLACFASLTGGVKLVDISTPNAPSLVGSLPGGAPNGFVPRDVEIAGQFAIFAEQVFTNAVAFVDITNPATPLFKGILDFTSLGDYAGTGIAASGAYVYVTAERSSSVTTENGTSGTTRLFIGQYLPLEDHAGNPPRVSIAAPADGSTHIEGDTLTVSIDASDDVAVGVVNILVDGQAVFSDTSAPYEHVMTVPMGVQQVVIGANAVDLGQNTGTAPSITFSVIPDPLTTVAGRVVDGSGNPIAGATVTTNGDASSVTVSDGTFTISGVTTIRGSIIVAASATNAQGELLSGSSLPFTAVRGGTTAVGTITAVAAVWEPNYGSLWSKCDDCSASFALPFTFSFYGAPQTTAWVSTNGYITFGSGDNTYTETIPAFASRPRISAFFDDLDPRTRGGVYVNNSLPGRFVLTYNDVEHFTEDGSNTLQIILYSDGRIQFGYRGITATGTGSITGITPGPNAQVQQVDFSQNRVFEVPPNTSVFEYFLSSSRFDLDNGFVLFVPRSGGGYAVQTVIQPPPAAQFQITSTGSANAFVTPAVHANAAKQSPFAHAEVEVTCSRDRGYRRHVNTDKDGNFTLKNVPAGGIEIVVRKKGQIVGRGAAVITESTDRTRPVRIILLPPSTERKE